MRRESLLHIFVISLFLLPLFAPEFILRSNQLWNFGVGLVLLFCAALLTIYLGRLHDPKILVYSFVAIGVIAAQWGLLQFLLQRDLGLQLIGESMLNAPAGVATFFSSSGSKLIRGYGPFEHSNVLGGTLLLNMMLLFHGAFQNGKLRTSSLSMLPVLFLGIFSSFSRSSWLGFGLLLFIFLYRFSFRDTRLFWLMLVFTILLLSPWMLDRVSFDDGTAVFERWRGYAWWFEIMRGEDSVPIDVAYPRALEQWLEARRIPFEPWDIDYVHSVPLIALAEAGWIPGGMIILVSLLTVVWWARRESVWLVGILPALVFDHYFVTQAAAAAFLIVSVCMLGLWRYRGVGTSFR